jgi:hypothetical protein
VAIQADCLGGGRRNLPGTEGGTKFDRLWDYFKRVCSRSFPTVVIFLTSSNPPYLHVPSRISCFESSARSRMTKACGDMWYPVERYTLQGWNNIRF